MTQFKINSGIRGEITSFKSPSDSFTENTSVSTDGVSTLKTSVKYVQQHKDISKLLKLYRELLLKDAGDLEKMVVEVEMLDDRISKESYNQAIKAANELG